MNLKLSIVALLVWLPLTSGLAEAPVPSTGTPAQSPAYQPAQNPAQNPAQTNALKSAQNRLVQLFTKVDGSQSAIVVFKPMDFTTWKLGDQAADSIRDDISKNGDIQVRVEKYVLKSLTLEEFRKAMATYGADVLITTILKQDNFYIYLYDRRTPYYIYAHNEPLPAQAQAQMNPQIMDYYAKLIERKVLYRFMQQQYFELPREESSPILRSEIPRWIASNESLALVNKDLESRFYAAVAFGAAISSGNNKGYWNSDVLDLSLGYRPFAHSQFYLEGSFESFAYSSFLGTVRYFFLSKDSPFRFSLGVGMATLSPAKSINFDATRGLGTGGTFVVPTCSLMVPIIDAYFKIESRLYLGPGMVFTLSPGLSIPF